MITEHTHSENNDWQKPDVEQLSVSETSTPQPAMDAPAHEEGQSIAETTSSQELPAEAESATPPATEESIPASTPLEQEAQPVEAEVEAALAVTSVTVEIAQASADIRQPDLSDGDAMLFPLEVATPLSSAEAVRPFTDFIEEFRQTEGHFNALLSEPAAFAPFVGEGESVREPAALLETSPEGVPSAGADVEPHAPAQNQAEPTPKAGGEEGNASPAPSEEALPGLTQPRLSPERPVSPLLRPATRPRLPRHARHRIEELLHPAELGGETQTQTSKAPVPAEVPVSVSEPPAVEEPKPEEPPARPARRYRFDRPSAATSANPALTKTSTPARGSESKEKRNLTPAAEHGTTTDSTPTPARAAASAGAVSEPVPTKTNGQETPAVSVETPTPTPAAPQVASPPERRRRSSHERTREKEQAAATPVVVPVPEPAPVVPEVEPAPSPAPEVPVEDLPPLEYAELQAASSRRRRRRRPGSASTAAPTPASNGAVAPKNPVSDLTPPAAVSLPIPAPTSLPTPPLPKTVPPLPPSYNIVSGYTISQMNQGNDGSGPFMGPEPSPARGSNFAPAPVRHPRNEALRNSTAHARHGESPTLSVASVNHMANVVSQAMQTQTDRMVAELRRANQVPTNVSVSLPPFPSTERVGVFVDVANLLYSARTLRMTVDFGKLLDFLRGNRRLVRAQAYCPTSPQPGDDQMFLQAVKGLGYRITTKNYKTFSSGAKKADLDLDLCMDVVRLVDGKAVDCIVLVSGDSDFMPMLDYCSDHGVRVEVAAFDESMSATLRQSCDLFVNLSMLEEIRA